VLDSLIVLVRAIGHLHSLGEKHGDIRRDHAILDRSTGGWRWIDFDFNYRHTESPWGYDLFGLGNVLGFILARGDLTVQALGRDDPRALGRLSPADMNIVFANRVMNLRKVYPYVPAALNSVLMRFAAGAGVYYEDTGQLLMDLVEARQSLLKAA
jgi:hypothetical protein